MSKPSSLATTDSSVLDFLRAFAVSLVLCDHFLEAMRLPSVWWMSQRLGWSGVMLFFVHTSLVLMFSINRAPADGSTLLKYFYTRRAFRIYPLSIVIVLAVVILNIPVSHWPWQSTPLTTSTLVSNLLLIQNLTYSPNVLGPLWTLPLELQMYVLLPFLYWAVRGGRRLDVAMLLWIGAVGFAFVQPLITDRLGVFQFAPCFMGGVIAFSFTRKVKAVLPFWILPAALAVAITLFLGFTVEHDLGNVMHFSWILSLSVGLLLPHIKETGSRIIRSVSLTIAKYSYSIYLTHMIAFWIAFVKLQHAGLPLRVIAGVSLMFILPFVGYHLIEAPGIALGARLGARFLAEKRRAASSPAAVAVNVAGS